MHTINNESNGVPVFENTKDDICCVNAWLKEEFQEVVNPHYTRKVDSYSNFNGQFSMGNINEFIDSLTITGKYFQVVVTYHSAN